MNVYFTLRLLGIHRFSNYVSCKGYKMIPTCYLSNFFDQDKLLIRSIEPIHIN